MDDIAELIVKIQNGDTSGYEEIHKKYEALIKSMSKKYSDMCSLQISMNEDFMQEGESAFYKAILTYDINRKDVAFGAYAKICIRNRLISCVRSANSKKRRKSEIEDAEEATGPQEELISRETRKKIALYAAKVLSGYEKDVFAYLMNGIRPKEIASKMGKDIKSVNNALCRIKVKLKRMNNNDT